MSIEEVYIYCRSKTLEPGYNWKPLFSGNEETAIKIYDRILEKNLTNTSKQSLILCFDEKYFLLITGIKIDEKDDSNRDIRASMLFILSDEFISRRICINYLSNIIYFEDKIREIIYFEQDFKLNVNERLKTFFDSNNIFLKQNQELLSFKEKYRFFDENNEESINTFIDILYNSSIQTKVNNTLQPILTVSYDKELNYLIKQNLLLIITNIKEEHTDLTKKVSSKYLKKLLFILFLEIFLLAIIIIL